MGSTIVSFFPHNVQRSIAAVGARLDLAFNTIRDDLAVLRERGRFTEKQDGWWLIMDDEDVRGEGPGFSITVHRHIAILTSMERFGAITRADQGVHLSLRRIVATVAATFGAQGQFAIAPGGYGDADAASDLALSGSNFEEILRCLANVMGSPSRDWESVESRPSGWYLSEAARKMTDFDS